MSMKRPEETNYPHSKNRFESQKEYLENLIEDNIYIFDPIPLFDNIEPGIHTWLQSYGWGIRYVSTRPYWELYALS